MLAGHDKRVSCICWHPSASGVLATCSYDKSIIIWDVEAGKILKKITCHTDAVYQVAWDWRGENLVSVSRDRTVKILNPRTGDVISSTDGHMGNKPSCVTWLGNSNAFVTTGFSKTSDREYAVWSLDAPQSPVSRNIIDSSTGVIIPVFFYGPNMLFLIGKGDTTIRVYECCDTKPFVKDLTVIMDKTPQRGGCVVPTQALDLMGCEV